MSSLPLEGCSIWGIRYSWDLTAIPLNRSRTKDWESLKKVTDQTSSKTCCKQEVLLTIKIPFNDNTLYYSSEKRLGYKENN